MTSNPAIPPASALLRTLGWLRDDTPIADDLGYECAMPYLWSGVDEAPAGQAERPDGDDPR